MDHQHRPAPRRTGVETHTATSHHPTPLLARAGSFRVNATTIEARTARPLDDANESGGRAVRAPFLQWDRLGFFASSLCAVHCLCLPWLLLALPFLASTWLADREFERAFVLASVFLAAVCTIGGCRAHRKWWLMGLVGAGAVVLLGAHATAPALCCANDLGWPHALGAAFGGGLLAASHGLNLSLRRREPPTFHGSCCPRPACSSHRRQG
ncbi:MAG TPA: hypothetical protein DCY13_20530 [Verrucomicrobiales bacterium]|nr:hypothetical protein [Verrucomicrobiales bacterium]